EIRAWICRTVNPCRKAVLKTRAVPTVRDRRASWNRAERLECGRVHRRFFSEARERIVFPLPEIRAWICRTVNPCRKAVLKTRAVPTLRDRRASWNRAERFECERVHRRFFIESIPTRLSSDLEIRAWICRTVNPCRKAVLKTRAV